MAAPSRHLRALTFAPLLLVCCGLHLAPAPVRAGDLDAWVALFDGKDLGGIMLREGYIALQAESHPVEFRKVEIRELVP